MGLVLGAVCLAVSGGGTVGSSGQDGVLLWIEAKPGPEIRGVQCRFEKGLPGRCMVLSPATRLDPVVPTKRLDADFAFSVWVEPAAFPSDGPGGFSDDGPVTLVRFKGSGSDGGFSPTGILRVRRHFLEFAWLTAGGWQSVMGRTWLPPKRWMHLAMMRRGDVFALYVDGQPDGRRAGARAGGAYERLELGRSGEKRRFIGRMGAPRLAYRALTRQELRRALAAVSGYTALRTPQVDDRWLRAGVLFTQPDGFPYYPAARVGPEVLHPLAEGCGIEFCLVQVSTGGPPEILIGADPRLFGARLSLHRPVGRDPGTAWGRADWPVYDPGKTLELGERTVGLNGRHFVSWATDDRGPTFLGRREGGIFFWCSGGSRQGPEFAVAGPVLFGGKALQAAMPEGVPVYEWRPGDVDGDGVPDMLITGRWGDPRDVWPHRERRLGARNPHVGLGRGYDISGRWLGAYRNGLLFWARGLKRPGAGAPVFGPVRPVYYGERPADRQVEWRTPYGAMTPAVLSMNGQRWVLLFGDVERILALPVRVDARGVLRCAQAADLLAGDGRLRGTYFQNQIEIGDIDHDGAPEILIGGNPGRIVVLEGGRPGAFREAGSLSVRGGWVATDTLSVPCCVDWDGDGRRDLIVGDASGLLSFWPGTERPTVFGRPVYLRANGRRIRHRAGYSGSLQGPGEAGWGYLQPTVADWDLDGDLDVVVNDITARLVLYRRDKDPWDLRSPQPFRLQDKALPVAWRSRPAVIPARFRFKGVAWPCLLYLDDESLLCAGIPGRPGSTRIVRSVRLTWRGGAPVRLSGWGTVSGRTKLSIADWDGDGDWDVLFGTNVGCHASFLDDPPPCATPLWIENTGTNRQPVFAKPRVIRLKNGDFINLRVHVASPWACDVDGNGSLDLITGAEDGKVYVFRREALRAPFAE